MNKNNSIQPWLSVQNAAAAVSFYKNAFNATETYRLETPDGLVIKLSVNGAEFWISGNNDDKTINDKELQAENIRMILIVDDPESFFKKSIDAGATEIFPVGEEHGWKLGRIVDPFGLHWEIGHPVDAH
ncbi:MAG: VOC family protein [Parafilimonas sp.]